MLANEMLPRMFLNLIGQLVRSDDSRSTSSISIPLEPAVPLRRISCRGGLLSSEFRPWEKEATTASRRQRYGNNDTSLICSSSRR